MHSSSGTMKISAVLLATTIWHALVYARNPEDDTNIIGGDTADRGEFPYQVSVQHKGLFGQQHICGGSVINEIFILTAAHCITELSAHSIVVVAGMTSLIDDISTKQEIRANTTVIHERYNAVTKDNDIALIKLESSLTLNDYVKAVDLPVEGVSAGTSCNMTGWGTLTETGDLSDILQKVIIPIVSRFVCRAVYGEAAITDDMICAGNLSGGTGACYGDRGGPLQCNGLLQGVSSWAEGCAEASLPGVYTMVANYVEWIEEYVSVATQHTVHT